MKVGGLSGEVFELAVQAVQEAEKLGAHSAEAYVLDAKSLTVEVANQALSMKVANDTGIGIRVISPEGRMGFAFSTDIHIDPADTIAGFKQLPMGEILRQISLIAFLPKGNP